MANLLMVVGFVLMFFGLLAMAGWQVTFAIAGAAALFAGAMAARKEGCECEE